MNVRFGARIANAEPGPAEARDRWLWATSEVRCSQPDRSQPHHLGVVFGIQLDRGGACPEGLRR